MTNTGYNKSNTPNIKIEKPITFILSLRLFWCYIITFKIKYKIIIFNDSNKLVYRCYNIK